jgi:predicted transcriptional regulator
MIKGVYQIKGKINKVLSQLLKADVTIGELEEQREVYPLTFKGTNYVVVK